MPQVVTEKRDRPANCDASITQEMIEAGAAVLLDSPHCELSQGLAEDLAEDVLNAAATVARAATVEAEIEITPEMIEAGVDFAADLEVENVGLGTLAQGLYRTMVLASRGQHHRKFSRGGLARRPDSAVGR